MSKVKDWEYDDVMNDYLKWQNELERLLEDEEPDEVSIQEAREIIAKYEDALFSEEYEDEEDVRDKIAEYLKDNLTVFELEDVEIAEMDIDDIEMRIKEFDTPLEIACDEVLQGIRDTLDEGLDDLEDE